MATPHTGSTIQLHGFTAHGNAVTHIGNTYTYLPEDASSHRSKDPCLADLRCTNPHNDKRRIERTKGGLLRDAYRWILDNDQFRQWHMDPQSRLLWINGDPGKGKTMLMCGIIDEVVQEDRTMCYFFCQAADANINNATAVVRSVISMLADQHPSLVTYVREKYDQAGGRLLRNVNTWDALSSITASMFQDPCLQKTGVTVAIDALDECITDLDLLLQFIAQKSIEHANVKWIVSSRNWPNIESALRDAAQGLSLALNQDSVSAAISIYIETQVTKLSKQNRYSQQTEDAVRHYLEINANGTFLWVALVCKELADVPDWEETEEIMKLFPPGLDALYSRMMNQILLSRHAKLCRGILASTLLIYRPITLDELPACADIPPRACGNDDSLKQIIGLCGSFLALRDRTIFFIHQSAKDFLLEKMSSEIFPLGMQETQYTLYTKSLQLMSKVLRRNIYGLDSHGVSIEQVSRQHADPLTAVRYSCVYWIDHFSGCNQNNRADRDFQEGGLIDIFLREKYLYWLEALSHLKSIPEGMASMSKLERLFRAQGEPKLNKRIHDACRFILYHKFVIENHPLQVYSSALLFSPTQSITRKQYSNQDPEWVIEKPVIDSDWSACLATLRGHDYPVSSVAWSHDNTRLATGSFDTRVKIWDLAGRCLATFKGHMDSVESVAWSQNDAMLATASGDRTIRIWDPAGRCLATLWGHMNTVRSVAWSHDNTRLASGSLDSTVKIWAPEGQCLATFENNEAWVHSVAWSHDDTRLAWASEDSMVKIWNLAGRCLTVLNGHKRPVQSVAWSQNSLQLVSGSYDGTIKIWNQAGRCLATLEGHGGLVRSVSWSHDDTRLASASNDNTVRIWDAEGRCLATLEGHEDWTRSVVWSQDDTRLASASEDNTVKVWDPESGYLQALEWHNSSVRSIVWAHDNTKLASVSTDYIIQVWEATGQYLATLEGHDDYVWMVTWSYDDARLASSSSDHTIRIWDPSGRCLATLEGHDGLVRSVAWSHDDTRLASASNDNTVRIWDLEGRCLLTLKGHTDWIRSVAWSYNDLWLAVTSDDGELTIWDTARRGPCMAALHRHTEYVVVVAWSHSNARLASGSDDGTVRVWDPKISTQRTHA